MQYSAFVASSVIELSFPALVSQLDTLAASWLAVTRKGRPALEHWWRPSTRPAKVGTPRGSNEVSVLDPGAVKCAAHKQRTVRGRVV
jgi:hypothetical protein